MKEVYIVTAGEYSDYHIVGIWDNKVNAQSVIDAIGQGSIEEWELNNEGISPGLKQYFVRMKKDGTTKEAYLDNSTYGYNKEYGFDVNGSLYNYCFAKDENHAIKITNEKRAKLIVENNW